MIGSWHATYVTFASDSSTYTVFDMSDPAAASSSNQSFTVCPFRRRVVCLIFGHGVVVPLLAVLLAEENMLDDATMPPEGDPRLTVSMRDPVSIAATCASVRFPKSAYSGL